MPDTAAAFVWAATLDVLAQKPGNVSLASPGHGMVAEQFVASARAAAPALCRPGAPLGQRVEEAVRASWASAGCNTNLGIVLLCAPLAMAAEAAAGAPAMPAAVQQVLGTLQPEDTAAVYRAITQAQPGGLGRAEEADVHAPPTTGLREAMALAAHRDSVARQYAQGYEDLFGLLLPCFAAAAAEPLAAMQRTWLRALATWPDSHIVRKHGPALAQIVMAQAQAWQARAAGAAPLQAEPGWAAWDAELKRQHLNPGTSADLAVATAMAHALWHPVPALAGMDSAGQCDAPPPGG